MNGYSMMADSYKLLLDQKKIDEVTAAKEIRIYEFLATCDEADLYRLVNSGFFNDIIKAYIWYVMKDSGIFDFIKKSNFAEKIEDEFLATMGLIFDTVTVRDVMKEYYD